MDIGHFSTFSVIGFHLSWVSTLIPWVLYLVLALEELFADIFLDKLVDQWVLPQ